jgi:hypothetical protein
MNRLLRQFAAVTTVLLLACPAGFCAVMAPQEAVRGPTSDRELSPTRPRCCQPCAGEHKSGTPQAPTHSEWRCCCARDARMLHSRVQLPDAPLAVLTVERDEFDTGSALEVLPPRFSLRGAPRLHVLLCVWRC